MLIGLLAECLDVPHVSRVSVFEVVLYLQFILIVCFHDSLSQVGTR